MLLAPICKCMNDRFEGFTVFGQFVPDGYRLRVQNGSRNKLVQFHFLQFPAEHFTGDAFHVL